MKVDYRIQYYDVITNPTWRTVANIKSLCRQISVKSNPIMMKFHTMNQMVIVIKMIRTKSVFLNLRRRTNAILPNIVFGHSSATGREILHEDAASNTK